LLALALAGATTLGVAGCGGGERQDANEPEGTFDVQVVKATFPAKQSIADKSQLRIRVRNADDKALPNVAVTIETTPKGETTASPQAFSSDVHDASLSDPSRPIWIVDDGPSGGDTAYTNTWALGRLGAGATKTFVWHLTAVKPGSYTVAYSVSPGLNGKARPAEGQGEGSFKVTIDDQPPTASVDDAGNVVRGD
jgi:hypothetical protein